MKNRFRSGCVAVAVTLVIVVTGIVFFLFQANILPFGKKSSNQFVMTEIIQRGDLLVTVTESGTLESAANVEVKCQVAGGSSILWIIPDGTFVEEGEKIER